MRRVSTGTIKIVHVAGRQTHVSISLTLSYSIIQNGQHTYTHSYTRVESTNYIYHYSGIIVHYYTSNYHGSRKVPLVRGHIMECAASYDWYPGNYPGIKGRAGILGRIQTVYHGDSRSCLDDRGREFVDAYVPGHVQ